MAITTLQWSERCVSLHMQLDIAVSLTVQCYSCLWQQVMVSGYESVCVCEEPLGFDALFRK